MKIAYFDCCYGAAGDMILGALVDAGYAFADLKILIERDLGVEGLRIERESVTRSGLSATRVVVHADPSLDRHRHLRHVLEIIDASSLPKTVAARAGEVFSRLARAEAKVHNTTVEKIHFHEVGCLDAIADVAGAMAGLEALGVERVVTSPFVLGSGTTRCAHGVIPVPAPATVELLRGAPTRGCEFKMEMTTPTGAAVLRTVSEAFGPQPEMIVEAVGHGAGTRAIEGHANFLRVMIGEGAVSEIANEKSSCPVHARRLALLTTEIDDMNPELLGDLMDRLFRAGCLDAHFSPLQMKKNRPGTQVTVLCAPERRMEFAELMLRHTSTFGLKILEVERVCLPRKFETIKTDMGPLEIKIGLWGEEILKMTPEFESCRRLAESAGLPLAEVYARAQAAIAERRRA